MKNYKYMKKFIILFWAMLITSTLSAAGFKPLINKNGTYVPFDETKDIVEGYKPSANCPKGSINYYRSCLGYGNGEVITHFNDACYVIALNAFNDNVIFILPKDTTIKSLTQQEVIRYLAGYKPNSSDFASNLKTGVEDGSIRLSFVENALGIKAENNVLTDNIHGFTYTFENGILKSYKSNDGFSDDAIDVKENYPQIFAKILTNARINYGTSKLAITEYVNGQCKYFRSINISYLRQASNSNINYNYALLYCILYEGMGLDEFTFLVPNAEISSSLNNYVIMSCGNYMFTFKDKVHVKN